MIYVASVGGRISNAITAATEEELLGKFSERRVEKWVFNHHHFTGCSILCLYCAFVCVLGSYAS